MLSPILYLSPFNPFRQTTANTYLYAYGYTEGEEGMTCRNTQGQPEWKKEQEKQALQDAVLSVLF